MDRLGSALRQLFSGLPGHLRSEVGLFKSEFQSSFKGALTNALFIFLCGALMTMGLLPFFAFLVIGLGVLFDQNYWLSALTVSLADFVICGTVGYFLIRKASRRDLSLPRTRESLGTEVRVFQGQVREIAEISAQKPWVLLAIIFVTGVFYGQLLRVSLEKST